ncbi:hypothetical protein GOP47_0029917 [Adiantum capillus-veneris]|nr:hypothetical protein GOP47_0029917 [Adiantum capillus-veneris]
MVHQWRFLDARLNHYLVEDFLVHDTYSVVALAAHQVDAEQYKQAVADILLFIEEEHAVWLDGVDVLALMQQTVSFLPSGCKSFDDILSGGFRDGTVTELFGSSSAGKTQICIQTAAYAALHGSVVVYIDTCNSFSPSRLCDVLLGLLGSKSNETWSNIAEALKLVMCYRVHDVFSLLELLHQMDKTFGAGVQESEGVWLRDTRLIVLDSISSVVSPILGSSYVQGHALMMKCGQTLKKIASENSLRILVTNHMVTGGNRIAKPALGESWKVVPNIRLHISREAGSDLCCVSLTKHSSMSCNKQAFFRLTSAGMESP